MQETEINANLDHNLLSFPGYNIETENNSINSRTAIYISSKIYYQRRKELEGEDSNLVIIDILGDVNRRLINLYRSFSPQNNVSQRAKFGYQLDLIKIAKTPNTIIFTL